MATTTHEPSHVTTIDQHTGDHSSGTPYRQLKEVFTRFSEYSQESWDSLDAESQEWWCDVLADLHAAEVELASLSADDREAACSRLDYDGRDLEDYATVIRFAIAG